MPEVAVVVTCYNYSKYIVECLESIRTQTYPYARCVIIDDCSTDNSVAVIEEYIAAHSDSPIPFRLIQNEQNLGQLGSFLRGIREAGEAVFLSFVDADDVLFPEFLSTHVQVHLANNVAMTCCGQIEIDGQSHVQSFLWSDFPGMHRPDRIALTCLPVEQLREIPVASNHDTGKLRCQTITPQTADLSLWRWGQTSCAMLRVSVARLFLHAEGLSDWRICADHLLFKFAHLVGNSCLFNRRLVAYRRHGRNGFARDRQLGGARILSPEVLKMRNDDEIFARDILRILINGRDQFLAEIGLRVYRRWVYYLFRFMPRPVLFSCGKLAGDALGAASPVLRPLLLASLYVRRCCYRLGQNWRRLTKFRKMTTILYCIDEEQS